MALNVIETISGINDTPGDAAASLDQALQLIDDAKTIFLCEIYRQGSKWYHVLIHRT